MTRQTVLLVEDDPLAARLLRLTLEPRGYQITVVQTGEAAEATLDRLRPSIVVLDLTLPGIDGLEVCRRLRARSLVPIVVVTARSNRDDRVQSLRMGADDILTKPYDPEELALRLEGVLRRAAGGAPAIPDPYHFRDLAVDFTAHRTTLRGQELGLTQCEQRLLEILARGAGMVQLADDLLVEVWGPHAIGQYATLHLHISRLRHKLGDDARQPVYLLTRPRVGYRLPAGE
jgi:DNA-binding response OmpR family regulator